MAALTTTPKVVFSSTLRTPLSWANCELIQGDAVEAVRAMKLKASRPIKTIGSLALSRSLLQAGLVDRYRVVVFPVITGATGRDRIFDGYPDVALELVDHCTLDGRLQLLEYVRPEFSMPHLAARATELREALFAVIRGNGSPRVRREYASAVPPASCRRRQSNVGPQLFRCNEPGAAERACVYGQSDLRQWPSAG